jgi:hypothetical protein
MNHLLLRIGPDLVICEGETATLDATTYKGHSRLVIYGQQQKRQYNTSHPIALLNILLLLPIYNPGF